MNFRKGNTGQTILKRRNNVKKEKLGTVSLMDDILLRSKDGRRK